MKSLEELIQDVQDEYDVSPEAQKRWDEHYCIFDYENLIYLDIKITAMGNFTITVKAVGGHGVDRGKKDGEIVDFKKEDSTDGTHQSPDSIAKDFVDKLKASGNNVEEATITHWPGQESEVQDDLITGVRKGNF